MRGPDSRYERRYGGDTVGVIASRRTAGLLLAVYLTAVALIVFWPNSDVATNAIVGIFRLLRDAEAPSWITPTVIEFATNVLLFIPLSLIGSSFKPRWRWGSWLLAGLACTLTIELAQMVFLSARYPAISDVIANTLGTMIGYLLVTLTRHR